MNYFLTTILSLLTLFSFSQETMVSPYLTRVNQSDSTIIDIIGKVISGEKLTETADGYTIVKNNQSIYEYAVLSNNILIPSGVKARNENDRLSHEKQYLGTKTRHIKPLQALSLNSTSVITNTKSAPCSSHSHNSTISSSGQKNVLAILINYNNTTSTFTSTDFNNMLNAPNNNSTGSVRDYFLDNSNGVLDINFDVVNWGVSSNASIYYGDINGKNVARELVSEAIDHAENSGINFSNYDNDNDGFVDGVIVIHSGLGAEQGSQSQYIWSHRSQLTPTYNRTYDGVTINDYMIVPETRNFTSLGYTTMVGIGVYCHEFGHLLGLPDLYDTDGSSNGIGNWGLMGSGSWLNYEASPANMCAWSKYDLDWASPTVLTSDGLNSIIGVTSPPQIYRLNTPVNGEYYLLENRQNIGFDSYLPGKGMLIWHIDSNVINAGLLSGDVNSNENHKGVDLVEAESTNLDGGFFNTNSGDAGDPFPVLSLNSVVASRVTLDSTTVNVLETYNGDFLDQNIYNISELSDSLYFSIGGDSIYLPNLFGINSSFSQDTGHATLNFSILNANNIPTNLTEIEIYLSEDDSISSSDFLIDVVDLKSFLEIDTIDYQITFNSSQMPGIPTNSYHILVRIDNFNRVWESDETDNTFEITSISNLLSIVNNSDIAIQNLYLNQNSMMVNFSQNANFEYTNLGTTLPVSNYDHTFTPISSYTQQKIYLSDDTIYDFSDVFLDSYSQFIFQSNSTINYSRSFTVPGSVITGNYYLLVGVNTNQSLLESDYSNNFDYTPLHVTGYEYDITIDINYVPGIMYKNQTSSVSATIENLGNTVVNSIWTNYYLSQDTIYDNTDYYIGSDISGNIYSNNDYSINNDVVSIPNNISSGIYYVIMKTDYYDNYIEFDETNNSDFVQVQITDAPDLFFIDASVSNDTIINYLPSNQIDITSTIGFNYSLPQSVYSSARFYFSDDTIIDNSDYYMGSSSVSLQANEDSVSISTIEYLSSNFSAGLYYVIIELDQNNNLNESNENNNLFYYPVYIEAPVIDLELLSVSLDTGYLWLNTNYDIYNTIRSNGNYESNQNIVTKTYLSNDQFLDASDELFSYSGIYAIPNLTTLIDTAFLSYSNELIPEGNYYFITIVDPDNNITETNENNNVLVTPIELSGIQYDLAVNYYTITPTLIYPTDSIVINATAKNSGNIDFYDPFDIRIYMSDDTIVDASDFLVNTNGNGLGALNLVGFGTLNFFGTPVGCHYFIFVIDTYDDIDEYNENDNIDMIKVCVTDSMFDIGFKSLSIESPVEESIGELNFEVEIENLGYANFGNYKTQFYLSTDSFFDGTDQLLYSEIHSGLQAFSTIQKSFTVNSFMESIGDYFLIGKIESINNNILDFYDNNNSIAKPFKVISDNTTSTYSLNSESIKVFPNPSKDFLNITLNQDNFLIYEISDVLGRKVLSGSLILGENRLNIEKLNRGSYIMSFYNSKKHNQIIPFIKK